MGSVRCLLAATDGGLGAPGTAALTGVARCHNDGRLSRDAETTRSVVRAFTRGGA
jgi:hypothetical protein